MGDRYLYTRRRNGENTAERGVLVGVLLLELWRESGRLNVCVGVWIPKVSGRERDFNEGEARCAGLSWGKYVWVDLGLEMERRCEGSGP